jgi:hypothetical protein
MAYSGRLRGVPMMAVELIPGEAFALRSLLFAAGEAG